MKKTNILMIAGIDPGLTGAIVILPNRMLVPPLIGGKIDLDGYARLFDELRDCFVCLEEVHPLPNTSAASNFTFGGMFFAARTLLHAKQIKHTLVQPKEWQALIWTNTDKVYKPGKTRKVIDTKATSLLAFKRLFPGITPYYGENEENRDRRTKYHEGAVDAYLIAEYLRRIGG